MQEALIASYEKLIQLKYTSLKQHQKRRKSDIHVLVKMVIVFMYTSVLIKSQATLQKWIPSQMFVIFFHYFRNSSFQVHVQITTSSIACLWSCLTRVSLLSCNKYQIKESKVELLIKPMTRNVDWQIKFEQNKWYIAN